MNNRRDFLRQLAVASAIGSGGVLRAAPASPAVASSDTETRDHRSYWLSVLRRLADPVLSNLARRELRKKMPVERSEGGKDDRKDYTHLEAFGRLLTGIAPWLELKELKGDERALQTRLAELARTAMDSATNPESPDFMNFNKGSQPLVDAAFLAQAILRAPDSLWQSLDPRVQKQVITALKTSRVIKPPPSNWLLFAATVETALQWMGEESLAERLEDYLREMLGYYKGDGAYGDGANFHFDSYNSFVIHPMFVDCLAILRVRNPAFEPAYQKSLARARRYAAIQERLISPEGTFPALGRSLCYRFGAFHDLAQMALLHQLPERVEPAQVRCALTAAIRKLIEAPGTFDEHGWLRIGFCGHQPSLGEAYISTGSLYLCSAGLLPLGLPPPDPFWSAPAVAWTMQKIYAGRELYLDHALHEDGKPVIIPQRQQG